MSLLVVGVVDDLTNGVRTVAKQLVNLMRKNNELSEADSNTGLVRSGV